MSLKEDISQLRGEVDRVAGLLEDQMVGGDLNLEGIHLKGPLQARVLCKGAVTVRALAQQFDDEQNVVGLTKLGREIFAFYRKSDIANKNMEMEVQSVTTDLEEVQCS